MTSELVLADADLERRTAHRAEARKALHDSELTDGYGAV
jgi:hypothetical protein